jgi:hypothetical protein
LLLRSVLILASPQKERLAAAEVTARRARRILAANETKEKRP